MKKPTTSSTDRPTDAALQIRRHLRFGWLLIMIFLTLGIGLEAMHGLKVGWYLDLSNSTRRLMFTLAHSHGTLLGLLNIGFAATVSLVPGWEPNRRRLAGKCLLAASILMPTGFFLGGLFIYGGDPGLGIALVPMGALLLLVAVLLTILAI
jgi:hypothetical protein